MRAEPPDDAGTIDAGHHDADIGAEFAVFVREHTPSLFATARLLTGRRETAEDLLQEVLTHLFPRWDSVRTVDNPLAYVRRAVVNAFISSTRRASRSELVADPHRLATLTGRDHEVVDHADAVATALMIAPLLDRLAARQRAALVLRYFHGNTDAEIGDALGCRRGTARSLVSRGLEALRHDLDSGRTGHPSTTARGAVR